MLIRFSGQSLQDCKNSDQVDDLSDQWDAYPDDFLKSKL